MRSFGLFITALASFMLIILCTEAELSDPQNQTHSSEQTANPVYILRKLLTFRVTAGENDGGSLSPSTGSQTEGYKRKKWYKQLLDLMPFLLGFAFIFVFLLLIYFVTQRLSKRAKDRKFLKSLAEIPPQPVHQEANEGQSELVFFVDDQETFKLDDLFEATADLQSHTLYSSLYKVILRNNAVYAVKRFKKLQISFEEFSRTIRRIGNLKHPNILPLIGYNSTPEEKLLIYKYQSSGSLLNLLENHIAGKKTFPWKLRLSIASGIARGLDYIYQNPEAIPHGNLKSSNIVIDEKEEALISEYGYTGFIDRKTCSLLVCNGYTAPERTVSEKGDVFSFGIILLELLTGKTVEKSGIDLPKWVRSMVREEWTGEVFDKELNIGAREYAFPLLNIALKCVANLEEDRPRMGEVMEKIEEVGSEHEHEDVSISSMASEPSPYDCCLLHTVIPEDWDTPASNY
ncbi:probably inactive receptor-like protein kinase At5g41680 [Euphorbia lathyris]|uniref:probably inactive receptor-like protein kinase At5g41680 n=1 Tax=Euphorbia lathyris TaxID=212925 RepID=UPI0033134DB6